MERARDRVDALTRTGHRKRVHLWRRGSRRHRRDRRPERFFILTAEPEVYNLPAHPSCRKTRSRRAWLTTFGAALALGFAAVMRYAENSRSTARGTVSSNMGNQARPALNARRATAELLRYPTGP